LVAPLVTRVTDTDEQQRELYLALLPQPDRVAGGNSPQELALFLDEEWYLPEVTGLAYYAA
jgi:hypothetical protein